MERQALDRLQRVLRLAPASAAVPEPVQVVVNQLAVGIVLSHPHLCKRQFHCAIPEFDFAEQAVSSAIRVVGENDHADVTRDLLYRWSRLGVEGLEGEFPLPKQILMNFASVSLPTLGSGAWLGSLKTNRMRSSSLSGALSCSDIVVLGRSPLATGASLPFAHRTLLRSF